VKTTYSISVSGAAVRMVGDLRQVRSPTEMDAALESATEYSRHDGDCEIVVDVANVQFANSSAIACLMAWVAAHKARRIRILHAPFDRHGHAWQKKSLRSAPRLNKNCVLQPSHVTGGNYAN